MIDIPSELDRMKLTSTFSFGSADPPFPVLSNSNITNVAATFIENIIRLKVMMMFPAQLADFSGTIQRITLRAEYETTGAVAIKEEKHDAPIANQIFQRFKQLYHAHTVELQAIQKDEARLSQLATDTLEKGAAVTVLIASAPSATVAFEYAFLNYLTSAWTIFETMAGDLWEAALNYHPTGLADLGGKRYQNKRASLVDQEGTAQRKQLPLDLLRSYSWDTKSKMGSILRTRYNFTVLAGIREAYGAAFYKDYDEIDKAILNDAFDRLSALRNVIVHKAAVIDNEYLQEAKRFTTLPSAKLGDKLTLDGELVSNLIHEVVLKSTDLLSGVDNWVSAH